MGRGWQRTRWWPRWTRAWSISSPPIEASGPIQFITPSSPEGLEVYRHSTAHLLAAAVTELFPDAHPGIGPPTETGFYYDFYREKSFTEEDLAKIEAKMRELQKADLPYERVYFPKEEGKKLFEQMGEFLKCQLIEEKAEPGLFRLSHRQVSGLLPRAAHSFHRPHQGVQAAERGGRALEGR